jgi:hypothetical protein
MSFVGGRYEYDLFFAYSHGAGLVDNEDGDIDQPLRDWTRNVARAVERQLSMGLNPLGQGRFNAFIDKDQLSAAALEDDIEKIAKSSALMVIFMSPTYLRSKWSGKEIGWFFEQANEEGRGLDHTVLRLVQETPKPPELPWPSHLLDSAGGRVTYGDVFYNRDTNIPIELDYSPREFRELAPKITDLVTEIRLKLVTLKKQIAAAEALETAKPPEQGVPAIVYVQGYDDAKKWNEARDALSGLATIVPDQFEPLPSSLPLMKTFRDRRLLDLADCNGLVLLRSNPADPVRRLVINSQFDLGEVQESAQRNVPWVLVDLVGEGAPPIPNVAIPTVVASDNDWPSAALKAMKL